MRNLIIPCAGSKYIDKTPQYLVLHPDGTPLIKKCMSGLDTSIYDRIIIAILEEDCDKFNADKKLKLIFSDQRNVEIHKLSHPTLGPADTVYETLKIANVYGEIVIKDSNNYVKVSNINHANFVLGLNLINYQQDVINVRNKSFIILNEQDQILDIVEKKFRSDVISLGMYGFKRSEDFIFAYTRLKDKNYKINKLYVSHVISYLIGYKAKVFHYFNAEAYENWNSDKEWRLVQKKYATYFLDIDNLFSKSEKTEKVLEALRILDTNGARFIAFTTEPMTNQEQISKMFMNHGIEHVTIVCNCSFSPERRMICNEEVLLQYLQEL